MYIKKCFLLNLASSAFLLKSSQQSFRAVKFFGLIYALRQLAYDGNLYVVVSVLMPLRLRLFQMRLDFQRLFTSMTSFILFFYRFMLFLNCNGCYRKGRQKLSDNEMIYAATYILNLNLLLVLGDFKIHRLSILEHVSVPICHF